MRILPAASPNFSPNEIDPVFIVLHYTACDRERALEIFGDRARGVCAHFVLDTNGDLYDLGNFWNGPVLQGAHAGVSHFELGGTRHERLNLSSIGIEIVNLNGNIFPYTDAQYASLTEILHHFGGRFPVLASPDRIIGHEHIAGFRGKIDPGRQFDWNRLFGSLFSPPFPARPPVMDAAGEAELRARVAQIPEPLRDQDFWSGLSAELERAYGPKH